MKQKTIEDAIRKSAIMIYGSDWGTIRCFENTEIAAALIMVLNDCWNPDLQDELGNGFLGIPNDRSAEVTKNHPGPIATIYHLLMMSNVIAKKSYLRNNPSLRKRIKEVEMKEYEKC